jgi:hypothetical protein
MDIRNILNAEPAALAEAVRQVLFALVLLNVIVLDEHQLAAIAAAMSAVLTILVRQRVTAPDTVDEILHGPGGEPAGPADDTAA